MDQTNQFPPINTMPNSTPPMNGMPSSFSGTEKPKKFGPIIAILIVILVIVIVSLYLLASSSKVKTFSGARADCVAGAKDCNDFIQVIDNGGIEAGQSVPQQNGIAPQQGGNVTGGVPNNGTVAPITNTADDVDSLQADLDASISGIDAQSI